MNDNLIHLLTEKANIRDEIATLGTTHKRDPELIGKRIPLMKRLFSVQVQINQFTELEIEKAQERIEKAKAIKACLIKNNPPEPEPKPKPKGLTLAEVMLLIEILFSNKSRNFKQFLAIAIHQILGEDYANRKRYE